MKRIKRLCLIILAACLITGALYGVKSRLKTALKAFAETSGNAKITHTLQNALYKHLADHEGQYLTIYYDDTKRISAISMHSETISLLASEMTMVALDALEHFRQPSFGIPIGNLTESVLLSGRGPLIPLRPMAIGHIASEIQSELQSAGINQTLHRVLIRFTIAVRYLAPIESIADTISIDIVVAETLVVGDVPIYRD